MSDPLKLDGLSSVAIEEAVAKNRKGAKDPVTVLNAETAAKREERMSSGKGKAGSSSMPPPPPPPTPDPVDRSKLLDKVGAYRERFPELKSRNKISGKSATEEIEDEIHFYEQQLGNKDNNMGMQFFHAGVAAFEQFNPLGLNLNGLTTVVRDNDDQFASIIDELQIKYGANMSLAPEWRLCLALGTTVYTVHAANSGTRAWPRHSLR
jgi:hypothetical protein